jgi:TIR domain
MRPSERLRVPLDLHAGTGALQLHCWRVRLPMGSPKPVIFISYSHKDRKWLEFVQRHLQVAVTNDHFETWDDRRLAGGDDWKKEIDAALSRCTAFVLLVSSNSLVSEFILKKEVQAALEAHWERGVRIYPDRRRGLPCQGCVLADENEHQAA